MDSFAYVVFVPAGIKEAGRHTDEIRILIDDGWMNVVQSWQRELAVCVKCTANKTVNSIADSVSLVLAILSRQHACQFTDVVASTELDRQ